MNKTSLFKQLLNSDRLEFLLEAHSGLSAKVVEEAGFKGIWASGLAISAEMGVRDSNEASWTQVLEAAEFMSDATSIPILLDADTGYGNFNNVRRLVRKLEQRNIAAVCIEDKLFPKTNSLLDGVRQPLAEINEFSGKIKAAKDTQQDEDFCVIARVEAFISGWGLEEALKRATAYHQAGADGILIHSKLSRPDEVVAFLKAWNNTCPVLIVPTNYYGTPTGLFEEAGVSIAIWANHLVRASAVAMQKIAKKIYEDRSLLTVEDEVAPVREIFRLQGMDELRIAEHAYLPVRDEPARAIVLAASRGAQLGALTADKPKTMLLIHGKPLLQRLVDQLNEVGIKDTICVTGYKSETVDVAGIKKVLNERFEETTELHSLFTAREHLDGPIILSYGDILFKKFILLNLLDDPGDIVLVVDADHQRKGNTASYADYVRCSTPYTKDYFDSPVHLLEMNPAIPPERANGEWIGLLKLSAAGAQVVSAALDDLSQSAEFQQLRMKDLLQGLCDSGKEVRVVYTYGHWVNVNDVELFSQAVEF